MSAEETQEFVAREPILSEKALARMHEIASDPEKALEFLKDAGFLDENGELAEPYRQPME
jgi:hypothetical protein